MPLPYPQLDGAAKHGKVAFEIITRQPVQMSGMLSNNLSLLIDTLQNQCKAIPSIKRNQIACKRIGIQNINLHIQAPKQISVPPPAHSRQTMYAQTTLPTSDTEHLLHKLHACENDDALIQLKNELEKHYQ